MGTTKKTKEPAKDPITGLTLLKCPHCKKPIGDKNFEWRTWPVGEGKATVGLVGCGYCFVVLGASVTPTAEIKIEQKKEVLQNTCDRCHAKPATTIVRAMRMQTLKPPAIGFELKPEELKLCDDCHNKVPHSTNDHA